MSDQERQRSPFPPVIGRPRKDARILAVLEFETWTTAAVVAQRLGVSPATAYQALFRAERRGLIEHKYHNGYRVRELV